MVVMMVTKKQIKALKALKLMDYLIFCIPDKGSGITSMECFDYDNNDSNKIYQIQKFHRCENNKDLAPQVEIQFIDFLK